MTVAVASMSSALTGTSPVSVPKPAITPLHGLMVAFLAYDRSDVLTVVPAGWTIINQFSNGFGGYFGQTAVVARSIDGTEGAGPYDFTFAPGSSGSLLTLGVIVAFSGKYVQIEYLHFVNGGDTAVTSLMIDSATPAHSGIVVASLGHLVTRGGAITWPGDWTEDYDASDDPAVIISSGIGAGIAHKSCTAGVATGSVTPTWPTGAHVNGMLHVLRETPTSPQMII